MNSDLDKATHEANQQVHAHVNRQIELHQQQMKNAFVVARACARSRLSEMHRDLGHPIAIPRLSTLVTTPIKEH